MFSQGFACKTNMRYKETTTQNHILKQYVYKKLIAHKKKIDYVGMSMENKGSWNHSARAFSGHRDACISQSGEIFLFVPRVRKMVTANSS